MRKKEHQSVFYEFTSISDLAHSDRQLIEQAQAAASKAYAPYSKYQVGCAVLMENGESFKGSNQENSAFPEGLCAERVAISYAKTQYPDSTLQKIAITAMKKGKSTDNPPIPCGGCLQVLLENEHRNGNQIKILLYGAKKILMARGVRQFLPLGFEQEIP